jgi:hypothetical protein
MTHVFECRGTVTSIIIGCAYLSLTWLAIWRRKDNYAAGGNLWYENRDENGITLNSSIVKMTTVWYTFLVIKFGISIAYNSFAVVLCKTDMTRYRKFIPWFVLSDQVLCFVFTSYTSPGLIFLTTAAELSKSTHIASSTTRNQWRTSWNYCM